MAWSKGKSEVNDPYVSETIWYDGVTVIDEKQSPRSQLLTLWLDTSKNSSGMDSQI